MLHQAIRARPTTSSQTTKVLRIGGGRKHYDQPPHRPHSGPPPSTTYASNAVRTSTSRGRGGTTRKCAAACGRAKRQLSTARSGQQHTRQTRRGRQAPPQPPRHTVQQVVACPNNQASAILMTAAEAARCVKALCKPGKAPPATRETPDGESHHQAPQPVRTAKKLPPVAPLQPSHTQTSSADAPPTAKQMAPDLVARKGAIS